MSFCPTTCCTCHLWVLKFTIPVSLAIKKQMLAMTFGIILALIHERLRNSQAWWYICNLSYSGTRGWWITDHIYTLGCKVSVQHEPGSWVQCWQIEKEKPSARPFRIGKQHGMEQGQIVFFVSISSLFGFSKPMLMFKWDPHTFSLLHDTNYAESQYHPLKRLSYSL